jgi:hypothetical protein
MITHFNYVANTTQWMHLSQLSPDYEKNTQTAYANPPPIALQRLTFQAMAMLSSNVGGVLILISSYSISIVSWLSFLLFQCTQGEDSSRLNPLGTMLSLRQTTLQ